MTNEEYAQQVAEFVADRHAALLSLDRAKILAYCEKYGVVGLPTMNEKMFWITVHKARTAAFDLPEAERNKSAAWLYAHGSRPMEV